MFFALWLQNSDDHSSRVESHDYQAGDLGTTGKIRSALTGLMIAASVLLTYPASAQVDSATVDSATIDELRAQIAALTRRLDQLEQENTRLGSSAVTGQSASAARQNGWTDSITISGDLRPRFENIDDGARRSDRNRHRIRGRVNITANLSGNWRGGLGLASGADDPLSTNQSLGNGASTKEIRLDRAYVTYSGFSGLDLTAGKYSNVFFKPGGQNLIFDGDYRPEGVALAYSRDALFFNAGTMILESDDRFDGQDKESIWGVQLGFQVALDDIALTLGSSYYDASVAGSMPFFEADPYGNSVDAAGRYLFDYEELEFFAEASMNAGGRPLEFYADYVSNLDADAFDKGWAIGANYGSASGRGNWELGYGYRSLEADALLGALTDSDFGGGGTDNKGHILSAAYGLSANTRLGLTYFINEYGEASKGFATDYNRLQLDLLLGF